MKGQALAIVLIIASGVTTFIMSISTMQSLKLTQAAFYRDYRFSEVFASLKINGKVEWYSPVKLLF